MKRSGLKLFLSLLVAICLLAVLINNKKVLLIGFLLLCFYFVFRLLYKAVTSNAPPSVHTSPASALPNATGLYRQAQSGYSQGCKRHTGAMGSLR